MSFGGAVSAMVTSIKNNARPKRKTYFDRNGKSSKNKMERNALLDKKASPELLAEIKKTMKEENRKNLIKKAIIIAIAGIFIIGGLLISN